MFSPQRRPPLTRPFLSNLLQESGKQYFPIAGKGFSVKKHCCDESFQIPNLNIAGTRAGERSGKNLWNSPALSRALHVFLPLRSPALLAGCLGCFIWHLLFYTVFHHALKHLLEILVSKLISVSPVAELLTEGKALSYH